ncbi:MAG: GNAT family N-acetyltransferase [Chloroflexaceae bacterium]|jgi:ribosomal protein S18 acetylase RimI-like enzyme|nr:GNAT family N-acetyltransferase [Chloroflexaceae bacterium]
MPEPSTIQIRRAARADVPAIVRMLADDLLGQQRECYSEPLPQSYYAAFELIDRDEQQELVVATQAAEVVGTLQLTFIPYLTYRGGMRAQIEAVRVDKNCRDQGIGQMLLLWAIGRARQKQCHMVQLTTNAQRGDAQRFYERHGFVPSHIGMKLELHESATTSESQ